MTTSTTDTTTWSEPAGCNDDRPWFLTGEGRQFFYDDPESYPYSMAEIAHSLSQICRFVGHLPRFYSVAQHSVYVTRAVRRLLTGIDAEKVFPLCRAALLHDASEAYLVDIPRPMKRLPGMEWYREMEHRTQGAILRVFNLHKLLDNGLIKAMDTALLANEKRDLRPPSLFDPVDKTPILSWMDPIVPMLPKEAERFFLDEWSKYS